MNERNPFINYDCECKINDGTIKLKIVNFFLRESVITNN